MKISKSKQELARIISENGGWRDGVEFSVSTCDGVVIGSGSKPRYTTKYGWVANGGFFEDRIKLLSYLKNWHQTILSRDEYFHLYPDPEANVNITVENNTSLTVTVSEKTTIEQLAADYRNLLEFAQRKQREADDAKADAEARLKALELAGEAIGLTVSPITAKKEHELVITDWRDLRVGDEIEGVNYVDGIAIPEQGEVIDIDYDTESGYPILLRFDSESRNCWCDGTFKFIRRP